MTEELKEFFTFIFNDFCFIFETDLPASVWCDRLPGEML